MADDDVGSLPIDDTEDRAKLLRNLQPLRIPSPMPVSSPIQTPAPVITLNRPPLVIPQAPDIAATAPAAPALAKSLNPSPAPLTVPQQDLEPHGWRKALGLGLSALAGATAPKGEGAERAAQVSDDFLHGRERQEEAEQERQLSDEERRANIANVESQTAARNNPTIAKPTNAFEEWRNQNPNAPISDWLKLQAESKPTPNTLSAQESQDVTDLMGTQNPKTGKNYTRDEAIQQVTASKTAPRASANHYILYTTDGKTPQFGTQTPQGILDANGKPVSGAAPIDKNNSMFGSQYSAVRLLDMAALYAPDLMPFALSNLNKAMGGSMTPDQMNKIASDAEQGMATFNGAPIGIRSHLNPTPATETQAQMADKIMNEIPRVKDEIKSLAPNLGPTSGRVITGFLAGTVGSTGDANLDQALGGLRADWPLLLSAASKMHIGTQKAIDELSKSADISKSSSSILTGFLDKVQDWAKQAQKEGRDINAPRAGGAAKDLGPAPKGYKEGRTGTLPDGTKVIVKGGRIVTQ